MLVMAVVHESARSVRSIALGIVPAVSGLAWTAIIRRPAFAHLWQPLLAAKGT